MYGLHSVLSNSMTSWTVTHQAPLSKEFPGKNIWVGSHSLLWKDPYSQNYGFSNSHVHMWELGHKEGWAQKNLCFWTVVLEKTLQSTLDIKKTKPANPKGNQPWIFIGRTGEPEAPIFWPPDVKSRLIRRILMLEKIEGRSRRGQQRMMVGWHHQLNEREFEQTPGGWEGKGSLECSIPWGCKESDTT